ncbi:MAG: GntR family transcriptional regulator [Clostridiales bacterium]|nr:GntR family transcriptional regulator [Clostridiales bacterium]
MKRIPLQKIIQNDILESIDSKAIKPGDKLPTEFELMRQYNVSRITVASALNELAKNKFIVRYPRRGSFVSNDIESLRETAKGRVPAADRAPAADRVPAADRDWPARDEEIKYVIGFIIPTIMDFFALNIIQGILACLAGDPSFSLIISSSQNQVGEELIIKDMLKRNIDGILLFPADQEIYNERILEMKLRKFPLVLIDRCLPGIDTHYVISDNVLGGRLAVSHLRALGHRRIAMCCGAPLETFSVKDRIRGYKDGLAQGPGPADGLLIKDILIRMQDSSERGQIEEQLLNPDNTAFITTDSMVALLLRHFFEEHGLNVPRDKSIVSYDAPLPIQFNQNPFTFIDQSEYKLGYEAAAIMRSLLPNTQPPQEYVKKVIAPKLVDGRTSALCAKV